MLTDRLSGQVCNKFLAQRFVNHVTPLILVLLLFALAGCESQKKDRGDDLDLLYIGWDENHRSQLFRLNSSEDPIQLTNLNDDVFDYAVAPDGRHVAFTTTDNSRSSALWQLEISETQPTKILDCADLVCRQPIWAADEKRLIYERSEIRPDGSTNSPYLWWLDMESGETSPVLEDSEARGTAARFSPDGSWLSYISPENEGVHIYNLDDGRSQYFPNEVGMPAVWSPDSDQIVFPNLDLVIVHGDEGEDHLEHTHDYQTATHLFIADTNTGEVQAISDDQSVEDSVAAWSPDGSWIAFGRRPPRTAAGRQLWLMRPDGSEAHPITEDPEFNYGPPYWSPNGRFLLFQRYSLLEQQSDPGVWMLDIESGKQTELAASGMQPQWLFQNP